MMSSGESKTVPELLSVRFFSDLSSCAKVGLLFVMNVELVLFQVDPDDNSSLISLVVFPLPTPDIRDGGRNDEWRPVDVLLRDNRVGVCDSEAVSAFSSFGLVLAISFQLKILQRY